MELPWQLSGASGLGGSFLFLSLYLRAFRRSGNFKQCCDGFAKIKGKIKRLLDCAGLPCDQMKNRFELQFLPWRCKQKKELSLPNSLALEWIRWERGKDSGVLEASLCRGLGAGTGLPQAWVSSSSLPGKWIIVAERQLNCVNQKTFLFCTFLSFFFFFPFSKWVLLWSQGPGLQVPWRRQRQSGNMLFSPLSQSSLLRLT